MRRNRPTSALAVLILLGVVIAGSSSSLGDENAQSDASTVPYWWGAGEYISDYDLDFVVARVVSVTDSDATVAHPPHVVLFVERVLRGKLARGKLSALWVASLLPEFR